MNTGRWEGNCNSDEPHHPTRRIDSSGMMLAWGCGRAGWLVLIIIGRTGFPFWILGDRDDTKLKSGEVVNELNECSIEKLTLQVFNYFKAKFMLFDIFLKPIWWFNQIYGMLDFLKFNIFFTIFHIDHLFID